MLPNLGLLVPGEKKSAELSAYCTGCLKRVAAQILTFASNAGDFTQSYLTKLKVALFRGDKVR